MVLLVQKFGGSSLTDLSKLSLIARRVQKYVQSGYEIVLVLSAMQGETDRLIELANLVTKNRCKREYDQLLAVGEQTAVCLMVMALEDIGVPSCSLNAWQAGIKSDGVYQRASIDQVDTAKIKACLAEGKIPVITGFQAMGDKSLTTLGRGGSDTTAVAIAAALQADECQVFVDVPGIFTADPKIEPSARLLHRIDIHQLLAYACLGAKVMQKRAVAIAARHRVPMRICPTFIEGLGTVVDYSDADSQDSIEQTKVRAVASTKNYVQLVIQGAFEAKDSLMQLLMSMSSNGADLEHSLQLDQRDQFNLHCLCSFDDYALMRADLDAWQAMRATNFVKVFKDKAKVSLLGYALVRDMVTSMSIVQLLQDANIKYYHIGALDYQVSVIIDEQYMELAVRLLHQYYKLGDEKHDVKRGVAPAIVA